MREGTLRRAFEKLKVMFQTEHEREVYQGRLKQARDARSIEKKKYREGMEEGKAIGLASGLHDGLKTAMELKFGPAAQVLAKRIEAISSDIRLRELLAAIKTTKTVEEFEKLIG